MLRLLGCLYPQAPARAVATTELSRVDGDSQPKPSPHLEGPALRLSSQVLSNPMAPVQTLSLVPCPNSFWGFPIHPDEKNTQRDRQTSMWSSGLPLLGAELSRLQMAAGKAVAGTGGEQMSSGQENTAPVRCGPKASAHSHSSTATVHSSLNSLPKLYFRNMMENMCHSNRGSTFWHRNIR